MSSEAVSPVTPQEDHTGSEGVGKESKIYELRFNSDEDRARAETWKLLCSGFFQRYVKPTDVVIDLGAGDGNFSRNITAARRIAVDLSPHVEGLQKDGVETIVAPATDFARRLDTKADVVFMSNFLEHLPTKRVMLDVLEECHRALKPGGRILILQPNVRYCGAAYWDYVDHQIALTEHSLTEGLEVCGYTVKTVIPRFLPYTARSAKGRLVSNPNFTWLIGLYLNTPLLWRFFGQQTFVEAIKK